MYFASAAEQEAWMLNKTLYTFDRNSYQREGRGTFKVGWVADALGSSVINQLYSSNYMMFKNTNFAAEGHLGYICRYALTPHFAVQGDARLSIMEGNFDRERITGVERMAPDIEFSLMAGICYDFNFRSKERRQKYYVEKNIIPYNTTEMPKFVAFIQQEDLDVVRYIDLITIVQYDTINDSVAILYPMSSKPFSASVICI